MDVANTVVNAAIISLVGSLIALLLARAGKGQFDVVKAEFGVVHAKLEGIAVRLDAADVRFDIVDRRFEALDRRFEAIDHRFDNQDQRFDRLEQRLEHRMGAIQASVDGMRSDLTQVALAVGVRPRGTNG